MINQYLAPCNIIMTPCRTAWHHSLLEFPPKPANTCISNNALPRAIRIFFFLAPLVSLFTFVSNSPF